MEQMAHPKSLISKMAVVELNVRSYCKLLLHAVKYPQCAVNGLLLAEKPKTKAETGRSLGVVDAIPLFHICLGLSPMLEIALMQIDNYCKNTGLVIGGYYQANEHYKDAGPDVFAYRIADKIHENFADACLIMLDNQKLQLECNDVAITLYQHQEGKWKLKDKSSIHLEQDGKALAAATSLLQTKEYRQLVDFDAHLDDVTLSWENTHLNDVIDRLL